MTGNSKCRGPAVVAQRKCKVGEACVYGEGGLQSPVSLNHHSLPLTLLLTQPPPPGRRHSPEGTSPRFVTNTCCLWW